MHWQEIALDCSLALVVAVVVAAGVAYTQHHAVGPYAGACTVGTVGVASLAGMPFALASYSPWADWDTGSTSGFHTPAAGSTCWLGYLDPAGRLGKPGLGEWPSDLFAHIAHNTVAYVVDHHSVGLGPSSSAAALAAAAGKWVVVFLVRCHF